MEYDDCIGSPACVDVTVSGCGGIGVDKVYNIGITDECGKRDTYSG